MVKNFYPELSDKVSETVSPMCMLSRAIKAKYPEAVTVFIGPCIAKKSEIVDQKIEGNADYALAFSEIRAIMKAKNVVLKPSDKTYQGASAFGKKYANVGGVSSSVLEYMKETGKEISPSVCKANGAAECKKALLLLKAGRLPEDFIEGMACEGGCVGGPSSFADAMLTKRTRDAMIEQADNRSISENLKNYDLDSFRLHR